MFSTDKTVAFHDGKERRLIFNNHAMEKNEIGGASFAFYGKFYKHGADSRASFTSGAKSVNLTGAV